MVVLIGAGCQSQRIGYNGLQQDIWLAVKVDLQQVSKSIFTSPRCGLVNVEAEEEVTDRHDEKLGGKLLEVENCYRGGKLPKYGPTSYSDCHIPKGGSSWHKVRVRQMNMWKPTTIILD